jgi:hypothetical protein
VKGAWPSLKGTAGGGADMVRDGEVDGGRERDGGWIEGGVGRG